jgi:hypothetical protein
VDLNRLYFDHQILLMRAQGAGSPDGRRGHEAAASGLAAHISCIQRTLGAPAALAWHAPPAVPCPMPAL